jgi:hypothetical protein
MLTLTGWTSSGKTFPLPNSVNSGFGEFIGCDNRRIYIEFPFGKPSFPENDY